MRSVAAVAVTVSACVAAAQFSQPAFARAVAHRRLLQLRSEPRRVHGDRARLATQLRGGEHDEARLRDRRLAPAAAQPGDAAQSRRHGDGGRRRAALQQGGLAGGRARAPAVAGAMPNGVPSRGFGIALRT